MSPLMPRLDDVPPFAPQSMAPSKHSFLRKLLGRPSSSASSSPVLPDSGDERVKTTDDLSRTGLIRRMSRRVVPSLPRPQTFKRQQSERRECLSPVEPSADERRAASVDRRSHRNSARIHTNPRASAPSLMGEGDPVATLRVPSPGPVLAAADDEAQVRGLREGFDPTRHAHEFPVVDEESLTEVQSLTGSEYDALILEELEKVWILNLSMHFRDRSKREKFFVTYREHQHLWRRVTVSLDYRDAPPGSLESELLQTKAQRDKSAKIYEAIRESLPDIQFYATVTNLRLETTDGRLHVHVVEDGNEIIHYPATSQIRHLGCKRIRERDILFESHMSGFVYKVSVKGQLLIKKEIPSPDTVDEFLYEVNALNTLVFSKDVIHFHGVVVDDFDEHVKGLLISYADQGALIDVVYENGRDKDIGLPWSVREKWARQIVQGLADIHESGFVQGDFTLSNIVIDEAGDAKIIDINRRGCPVGWEPPEATALIEAGQRISMYIGVKSDLYQLGMVLWALATMEDEPEAQGRPLMLGPEADVPDWYREMTEICLSNDPRLRMQASALLQMFPHHDDMDLDADAVEHHEVASIDGRRSLRDYVGDRSTPSQSVTRTVESSNGWSRSNTTYIDEPAYSPYSHTRGRSPPSPPTNYDGDSERETYYKSAWAANRDIAPSYSDSGEDEDELLPHRVEEEVIREPTPTPGEVLLQDAESATNLTSTSEEDTTYFDDEKSIQMSLHTQEAIQMTIVNLESCKSLSIIKTEKVPRKARSISSTRPRVEEMWDSETEPETEPEYTTSPGERRGRKRKAETSDPLTHGSSMPTAHGTLQEPRAEPLTAHFGLANI